MKVEARPVSDREIVITLTEREAGVIRRVCAMIEGDPRTTDRRVWDTLACALDEQDVSPTPATFGPHSNVIAYRG